MFYIQYDSTGIHVVSKVQIVAKSHQSACVVVSADAPGVSVDHCCLSEKLVPSVTHRFNITEKYGDSISSGGCCYRWNYFHVELRENQQ